MNKKIHKIIQDITLQSATEKVSLAQWISLLYRRVQKIEQIEPDHCDRYQNNHIKNAIEWHWSPTSEMVGTLVKFH